MGDYPDFSDDEVKRQFELFKHYDLDDSGFITAENMLDVLKALDVKDVSTESVIGMIEEVAVLTGHENDGRLSFRDFMNLAIHDKKATENLAASREEEPSAAAPTIDEPESPVGSPAPAPTSEEVGRKRSDAAAEDMIEEMMREARRSEEEKEALLEASINRRGVEARAAQEAKLLAEQGEVVKAEAAEAPTLTSDPAPTSEEAPKAQGWSLLAEKSSTVAPPALTKRKSSMSALNELASGRIKAFQQVATEATQREKEKLAKFNKQPAVMCGPMVNSDNMHLETLQSKLKAFEVAAQYKGKLETRKTWKKVSGASNYQAGHKIMMGGMPAGVAPKKKLSDLP